MGRPSKPRTVVHQKVSKPAQTAFPQEVKDTRAGLPVMGPELALVYAKLLTAGCPERRAVLYVVPLLPVELVTEVALMWKTNVHVIAAINEANGGAWWDLEPDKRAKLAYAKSGSEAAFWLWDTNFADLGGKDDLEKLKIARGIVKEQLGLAPDEADPMQAFSRFMLDMARSAQAQSTSRGKQPPQLKSGELTDILGKLPKPN